MYARTIGIGADHGLLMVKPAPGTHLAVGIRFPRVAALPVIIAKVRRVFDLSADPAAIGEHLARDPALAPLVVKRPGLRVPGAWDGFELAVRAILGQQITVGAAKALAGRLARAWGSALPDRLNGVIPGLTHVFPAAADLASADLSSLPMPQTRSAALASLAAAVTADPLLFGPRRSLDEAIATLRSLAGVGEWTAQYIAMRELREPDAFPAADVGLMRALRNADGVRPTAPELLAHAERWRPWRAYAALHLWASLTGEAEPRRSDQGTSDDRQAA